MGRKSSKKKYAKHLERQRDKTDRKEALGRSYENLRNMQKPRKKVTSFIAKYTSGECSVCFLTIEKGQRVRYDSEGQIHHVRHEQKEPIYTICSSCFLTKPCECDG